MRRSSPTARITCCTSPPICSQRLPTMFAYEIFMARNAFETCLISSALWTFVATNVGGAQGGQPVECTGQSNRRSTIGW